MKTRQLIVQCEGGLHLRVAARIVQKARQHKSALHLRCAGCPRANACSIMELLKLGAAKGTSVEVVADGPDEDAALAALSDVFGDGAGI